MPASVTNELSAAVPELRRRLDEFYSSTAAYDDFNREVRSHRPEWVPVRRRVVEMLDAGQACRILEFGCGRTGFGHFLGADRPRITFDAQDITDRNRDCLAPQVDTLWVGDLRAIDRRYDIIFSTYVWEHVSEPRATLKHLLSLLSPGGSLFLFCPRYDLPGYVPPSARHYSLATKCGICIWLTATRLGSILTGNPRFLIHTDPALFHHPWTRDADAIHWPSWWDLTASIPGGYRLRSVPLPARRPADWVRTRMLTLCARIDRSSL